MALQVSLSNLQYNKCGSWIFTDTAGTYSATNTDGWTTTTSGGSNLQVDNSSIQCAELIITLPSGTSITIDIIDNWEVLTGLTNTAFDSSTTPESLVYTVNASTFLNTTTFPDGIYNVVYRVGNNTTYATSIVQSTVTYNFASYCGVECCVEQLLAAVHENYVCEDCSNTYIKLTTTLWALLQALKASACLADTTRFENILATLQQACEDAGCSCT